MSSQRETSSAESDHKAVLYSFEGSVWSSAPRLAIAELGFAPNEIEVETVNLFEGENFEKNFLNLNPAGTLPTLITPEGDSLDNTIKVVNYLVDVAPVKPKGKGVAQDLVEKLHADDIDPNDLLLGYARNDEERKAKGSDLPGKYWRGRQPVLEKKSAEADRDLKSFYQKKLEDNTAICQFYDGTASKTATERRYAKAAELWSSVGAFLSGPFAQALASRPSPSSSWPFFSDDAIPGAVDFHAIAWLARTVTAAGGSIEKLEEAIGGQKVDASVRDYYEAWKARESFKKLGIL